MQQTVKRRIPYIGILSILALIAVSILLGSVYFNLPINMYWPLGCTLLFSVCTIASKIKGNQQLHRWEDIVFTTMFVIVLMTFISLLQQNDKEIR
jgi:hypothetical protein